MLKAPPIPKYLLIHSIGLIKCTGKNGDYGEKSYAPLVTITNVRVDSALGYMRSGVEQSDSSPTVVFMDSTFSKPFVEPHKEDKVIFKGKEYVIQRVIPCYQPGIAAIHHYEMELV